MLTGCPFGYDISYSNTQYVTLQSTHVFAVNNTLHIKYYSSLPVTVYNPNTYDIIVETEDESVTVFAQSFYTFVRN